jgi:hypothetical protein
MEYIRSHETEKLFELLPFMQAIQNGLKQGMPEEIARDDYIYSLAIGNRTVDSMPPSGNISNPTCNIATCYVKTMKRDIREIMLNLSGEIIIIATAIDRISCAFRRLPSLQQNILMFHYWHKLPWRDILDKLQDKNRFLSQNAAKRQCQKGIDKLTEIIQFPHEEYNNLMNILHNIAK